jgi:glycosyltransferase involved in cell wall biosynthesis
MRILALFDGDYPWDVRVEKCVRALAGRGHEVVLLARNRKGRRRQERVGDVVVWRLPHAGRLDPVLSFPAFFNPLWAYEGLRAVRRARPQRILVRDLPLAPLGIWLGRRAGCPVIVDMAEPYPEALRSNWQFDGLGGMDHLLRNPRLADAVERWVVRRGPRTLVVSDETGARLERIGLPPGRWTLVGNTPELEWVRHGEAEAPVVPSGSASARHRLIFTGILVGDRGLDVALRGLAILPRQRRADISMLVVGDGPARPRLEREARELGVQEHVEFLGWVPHAQLPGYLRVADVGLLPFHRCTHIETTLANKLFDYMAVGLPVLASDAAPMVRILRETGGGAVFQAGNPEDFARVLSGLLDEPDARRAMGARGCQAVRETYNWTRDAQRLIDVVERP